jgi:hypothetical protein
VVALGCALFGCDAVDSHADWEERWQQMGKLGRGFLVWESNRSGRWRIWYRNLDGSGLRQLSPEEEGRDHFAPHLSPDGTHLAYLSYPVHQNAYQSVPSRFTVPLHLLRIGDGSDRVLVPSARSYKADRAVVWIGNHELIYIDGRGFTRRLEIASGEEEQLTEEAQAKFGFLINPTMTHATRGRPASFSAYDPQKRRIALRRAEDGCQPYFSHDGRWGFWIEANGGPVRRIDLITGATGDVIGRDDPRMPEGHGYLYFPMLSSCQRLLAFAASRSPREHDHFKADYDVFVGRVDPLTLELIDEPVRYSFDPGTDRFPDVFLSGMELGHHRGEAPLSIALEIPDGDMGPGAPESWDWDFGDGTSAVAETGRHNFERPGLYQVRASRGAIELFGDVKVDPARPPEPKRVLVGDAGREVSVVFDEPIAAAKPSLRFESGAPVRDWHIAEDGRTLALNRDSPVETGDHLLIAGFTDRAQIPNPMEAVAHTYELERHRKARFDRHGAMLVSDGYFRTIEFSRRVVEAFQATDSVTLEATIQPAILEPSPEEELAGIVTFSREEDDVSHVSFALAQRGDELQFRLGTTLTGLQGSEAVSLGRLSTIEPTHVIISYRPGRLTGYVNGEGVLDTEVVQGDLTSWSGFDLLQFGMGHGALSDWDGTIEGVALHNRFMGAGEAAANARAYLELIAEREPLEQIELRGKLVGRSHVPTLKEIVPYREALVMYEYEVLEVLGGELGDETVRVAHWAILDGRLQSAVEHEVGEENRLTLEPFDDNPQVENTFLSDTLELRLDLPIYLDVDP